MKPTVCLFTPSMAPSGVGEHMLALAEELRESFTLSLVCPPSPSGSRLLERARALMPSLAFDALDVLIVDQMGKNISGTGMDTHVLGRMYVPGVAEADRPRITAVVVLDLSPESHGNAAGVGLADFTTERLVRAIDWHATYMNAYTSGTGGLLRTRLPTVQPTDRAAIAMAIRMCGKPDPATVRLARIKNTLLPAYVELSASLLPDTEAAQLEVTGPAHPMRFDSASQLI